MGALLRLIAGPGGTIIMYVLLGLFAAGTGLVLYKMHNDGIRREALAQFNKTQLEESLKIQKQFADRMIAIGELQNAELRRLAERNIELERQVQGVTEFLNSPRAQEADRPASEVLSETLRRLGGQL
jgi:hypothetical protein